jgi:hypothetical protein
MLSLSVSAAGQSGVNEYTSLEGTGIGVDWYDDMAYGGEDFSMTIEVEEGSNISSVVWITQICINTGVCFAPESNEMTSSDGITYESQVDVDRSATYINWKFVLTHEDDSTSDVPEEGFGWKIWSDCWWDNGSWGGPSTSCQDEEGVLPGPTAPLAALSLAMAALMARRD